MTSKHFLLAKEMKREFVNIFRVCLKQTNDEGYKTVGMTQSLCHRDNNKKKVKIMIRRNQTVTSWDYNYNVYWDMILAEDAAGIWVLCMCMCVCVCVCVCVWRGIFMDVCLRVSDRQMDRQK